MDPLNGGASPVDEAPQESRWMLLFKPDPRTPEAYAGDAKAQLANKALDALTRTPGVAGEAKVGESVALCADVVGLGRNAALPPIAHLGWSLVKWRMKVMDAKGQQVATSRVPSPGQ